MHIHNRGFNFLIPIGRVLTQQEEKNDVSSPFSHTANCASPSPPITCCSVYLFFIDTVYCVSTMQADEETDGSGSEQSDGGPSLMEDDGENDSNQDLDASMEDLDDDGAPDSEDNNDGDITPDDLDDDSGSI
jgi:hypothetical protein